ncbi:hypothetical protein BH10CYA1_BH10CYA1_14090 [soil metagenome]
MKQPCHRTLNLVEKLESLLCEPKPVFGGRKKAVVARAVEIVKEIEKVGNWSSVPYLVQFILQPETEIAESAGRCVETLLRNIRPSLFPQLDERLRGGLYNLSERMRRWQALKSFEENKYIAKNQRIVVTGIVSFHNDGFIRQTALKHLSEITSGAELPFLLIRLSDWVQQVRVIAINAVEQRVKPDYLQHFVHNIVLLDRIMQRQRLAGVAQRTALIERIFNEILQPTNRKILLDGLQHKDFEVRRTCLKLLRSSSIPDLSEILDLTIHDKDKTNRQIAIELSNRLPFLERLKLLNQLLWDRSAFVRLESLRILCNEPTDSSTSQLMAALLDRSSAVREFARWKLTDLESRIDFRKFYLEQIANNENTNELANAALGLGEIGRSEDAQMLIPRMIHSSVTVRKSVIQTLARLDANHHSDLFIQQFQNEAPGISRVAANALRSTMDAITAEELWTIFTTTPFLHVKRNVLRMFNETSKWDRIIYLLLIASGDNPRFRTIALSKLRSWHSEFATTWAYTKPTVKQLELLIVGMQSFPEELPVQLREALEECIKINA